MILYYVDDFIVIKVFSEHTQYSTYDMFFVLRSGIAVDFHILNVTSHSQLLLVIMDDEHVFKF